MEKVTPEGKREKVQISEIVNTVSEIIWQGKEVKRKIEELCNLPAESLRELNDALMNVTTKYFTFYNESSDRDRAHLMRLSPQEVGEYRNALIAIEKYMPHSFADIKLLQTAVDYLLQKKKGTAPDYVTLP